MTDADNPGVTGVPQCAATPECHDSETAYYAFGMGNGTPSHPPKVSFVYLAWWPFAGAEQMCRAHARLKYRRWFGGRR